ncbi:MAG: paraquat-inducible protein A, partial [Pseudomonadota bacterium]
MSDAKVTACHECDLLVRRIDDLEPGTSSYCPRCGHKLDAEIPENLEKIIALSCTGIMLLIIAASSVFISF